jgi:hypothetical protein
MFEIAVSTGDALGVFNLEVEVFGGSVSDVGVVEVSEQLGTPGMERACAVPKLSYGVVTCGAGDAM